MQNTLFRGRRAAVLENALVRVTVLVEGGHIAEVYDKTAGVNPLWTPPWPSLEPSMFDEKRPDSYGTGSDAKLLAGIMGHNVCLDLFGGPSEAEVAAGLTAHGEASVVPYELTSGTDWMMAKASLPIARLEFERRIQLEDRRLAIHETVTNVSTTDRPIGWTQHVTLGPPFLQNGATEFRASATRSKVYETTFGPADYLVPGAEFDWPAAPRMSGGTANLQVFADMPTSSAYTAHLMDQRRPQAYFVAFSPAHRLAFGYVWRRDDFPWMGIWEENRSRTHTPWNGRTIARGMEFGVSPFPESREAMVRRGRMFNVPAFRGVPGRSRLSVEYRIITQPATVIPEALE